MRKRILALAVCIIFCISSPAVLAASSDDYQTDVKFLQNIGAYESVTPADAGDFVTRAEFAIISANLMNLKPEKPEVAAFVDVASGSYISGVLNALCAVGVITGDAGGTFRPDEYITSYEASLIMLRVLGYTNLLKQGMSFESALSSAELNLYDGEALSWAQANRLIRQALESGAVETVGIENGENVYESGDRTILNIYHNIFQTEGIVTAVGQMYITEDASLRENQVMIDGRVYDTGLCDASGMLGYSVEIWYSDKASNPRLVHIEPSSQNEIMTFNGTDFVRNSGNTVYYSDENSGKEVRVNIDVSADYVYNTTPALKLTGDIYAPSNGKVTYIDNNGDGKSDVVLTENYETFVLGTASSLNEKIYDKYYNKSFDLSSENKDVIFVSDRGDEMAVGELFEWDVVNICESADASRVKAVYSTVQKEGIIKEYDSGEQIIRTETDTMKIGEYYLGAADFDIRIGSYGVFELDINGNVAAINYAYSDGKRYGYYIDSYMEKGIGGALHIKYMNDSGEILTAKVADKAVIDGEKYSLAENAAAVLGAYDPKGCVMVYKINSDGELTVIDSVITNKLNSGDCLEMMYTGYMYSADGIPSSKTKLQYKSASGIFGGKVSSNSSTKFFYVPETAEGAIDDDYRLYTKLKNDEKLCIEAYTTTAEAHDAECVIIYHSSGTKAGLTTTDVDISLIDKISRCIDGNGNEQYKLHMYTAGKYEEVLTNDESVIDNVTEEYGSLKRGDVIRYDTDSTGAISYVDVVYQYEKDAFYLANPSASFAGLSRIQLCYAYETYGSNIWITRNKLESGVEYSYTLADELETHAGAYYNILVYNVADDEVGIGSVADIEGFTNTNNTNASKMIIYDRYGEAYSMIVYIE